MIYAFRPYNSKGMRICDNKRRILKTLTHGILRVGHPAIQHLLDLQLPGNRLPDRGRQARG